MFYLFFSRFEDSKVNYMSYFKDLNFDSCIFFWMKSLNVDLHLILVSDVTRQLQKSDVANVADVNLFF